MSEGLEGQFIFADKDLNPTDLFLLQHIGGNIRDAVEIQRLADGFLNRIRREKAEKRLDLDHSALTAYLFSSFYGQNLTREQRSGINEVLREAGKNSSLYRSLNLSLSALDTSVRNYYDIQEVLKLRKLPVIPFDFYVPSSLENGLADIILNLKCNALKQEFQGRFQKRGDPDMVIKYFTAGETDTNEFGIWMSVRGIPFDKSKI